MAGFNHASFTSPSPPVAAVVSAWLSAWLGQANRLAAVTGCTIAGQRTMSLLSSTFRSGSYLPSSGLDTNDRRGYPSAHC